MSDAVAASTPDEPRKESLCAQDLIDAGKAFVEQLRQMPEQQFHAELHRLKQNNVLLYTIVKALLEGREVVVKAEAPAAPPPAAPEPVKVDAKAQEQAEFLAKQIAVMPAMVADVYLTALKDDEPKLYALVLPELEKLRKQGLTPPGPSTAETIQQAKEAFMQLPEKPMEGVNAIRIDSIDGMRAAVHMALQFRAGQISQTVFQLLLSDEMDRRIKMIYAAHQKGRALHAEIDERQKQLTQLNNGISEAVRLGKCDSLEDLLKETT